MRCAGESAVEANRARELNSGLRIGWTGQFDFTMLPFRNLSKGEGPSSEHRVSDPVLFVVVSSGRSQNFVAPIVEHWPELAEGTGPRTGLRQSKHVQQT